MPQPINGNRDLTAEEIDTINGIKKLGLEIDRLVNYLHEKPAHTSGSITGDAMTVDQRWVALGRTHLQQGFMALTRAVAKPGGF